MARANLAVLTTQVGLHGHTHVPIAFCEDDGRIEMISPADRSTLALEGRRALVNPGSVGQPRDGVPLASYLVYDTERTEVTWHRVGYDIVATQAAMRAGRTSPAGSSIA